MADEQVTKAEESATTAHSKSKSGKVEPQPPIRIINGGLDERDGEIILRGRVDPNSYDHIGVDDYQREVLTASKIDKIKAGFLNGSAVPCIFLGMRGQKFVEDASGITLLDPVFVVDGLQRLTAAKSVLLAGAKQPCLGAEIHFDTNRDWEREKFLILNRGRTRVSASVELRNLREKYGVVDLIYGLSLDSTFPLAHRVCWRQYMTREEILQATVMFRVIALLHSPFSSYLTSYDLPTLVNGMQALMEKMSRTTLRENIETFFGLVEDLWGIKSIRYRDRATWMKYGFLSTFAQVLSMHLNFWEDLRLHVDSEWRSRFETFPVSDPAVAQIANGGASTRLLLRQMMLDHLLKGKKTHKLYQRKQQTQAV
jgi:hypothetical protein